MQYEPPCPPAADGVSRVRISDDPISRGCASRPAQSTAVVPSAIPKVLAETRWRYPACVIEVKSNTDFSDEPRSVRFHLLRAERSSAKWLGDLTLSPDSHSMSTLKSDSSSDERGLCRRRRTQQERQARCEPCSLMHRQRPLRGWCISSPIPDSGFPFFHPSNERSGWETTASHTGCKPRSSLAGLDPPGDGLAQSFQQSFQFGLAMLHPRHAL